MWLSRRFCDLLMLVLALWYEQHMFIFIYFFGRIIWSPSLRLSWCLKPILWQCDSFYHVVFLCVWIELHICLIVQTLLSGASTWEVISSHISRRLHEKSYWGSRVIFFGIILLYGWQCRGKVVHSILPPWRCFCYAWG